MYKFFFLLSLLILYIETKSLRQDYHLNPLKKYDNNFDKHDSAQKYKHEYSSRTTKSDSIFGEFMTGCLLILYSILMLWFNERRAVITRYRLLHAAEYCMKVPSSEINPNCDGVLIHTSGKAYSNVLCADEQFGINESNCYKLIRNVEILQWVEKTNSIRIGNDRITEYSYDLSWCSNPVYSGNFRTQEGHRNDPSYMVAESKDFLNPSVYVGMFKISDSLKSQTSNTVNVNITPTNVQIAQQTCGGRHQFIQQSGQFIYFKQTQQLQLSGDLRVSFSKVPCGDVTIISQQSGESFVPYVIHDKYDENNGSIQGNSTSCSNLCELFKQMEAPINEINWIAEQTYSREQLFNSKVSENNIMTCIMRLAGWFIMGVGFILFFSPVTITLSYFPSFGNFIGMVSGLIFVVTSFIIGTIISLFTIALAWVWYRPLYGIMLILTGSGLAFALKFYIFKNYG